MKRLIEWFKARRAAAIARERHYAEYNYWQGRSK